MQQPEKLTLKKKKKSSFIGFPSPNPERDKGNPMEPEGGRRAGVEVQNRETEELTTDSHLSSWQASSLKEARERTGQTLEL